MSDSVNKPNHYTSGGVECIDGTRAALGEGFVSYCRGNVIKYVWRCGKKGDAVEDLRKAAKYLEWAIEAMESEKKPETLAIPEGWRELEENEPLSEDDLFDFEGEWVGHEYDTAGGVYSSRIHRRHIRKIETEKPSESQSVSHIEDVWVEEAGNIEPTEWTPKVGDRVRVIKPLKTNIKHPHWPPDMDEWNGRVGVVSKSNLELKTVLIDGFHDGSGYQWRFSFDWLRYEGSTSEAAQ